MEGEQPQQQAPTQQPVQGIAENPPSQEQVQSNSPEKSGTAVWKTILTVFFLLFFTPIGLILMFLITKWPKWIKILLTVIFLVIPILLTIFYILLLQSDAAMTEKSFQENVVCVETCAKEKIMQNYSSDEATSLCQAECGAL